MQHAICGNEIFNQLEEIWVIEHDNLIKGNTIKYQLSKVYNRNDKYKQVTGKTERDWGVPLQDKVDSINK